jgi:hypothetical protein
MIDVKEAAGSTLDQEAVARAATLLCGGKREGRDAGSDPAR